METSNLSRRVFLTKSATVAAVGATVAVDAHAAVSQREIEHWKNQIGSRFRVENGSLVLRSVAVTDYSTDAARPRHLRPHSIELLFVRDSGSSSKNDASDLRLQHRSEQLILSRVVSPEGESGEFYEGIIN